MSPMRRQREDLNKIDTDRGARAVLGLRMKLDQQTTIVLACTLAAVAALNGCRNAETGSEGAKRPTVGVVQPVERPVVDYAYFTGQIQAVESVQVRARVTGYLKRICYTPGKIVMKDTVLFEIDPLPYKAQVEIAKGKLAEAEAQVLERNASVAQAGARVAIARTKVAIDKEVAKTSGAISKLTLEEDDAKLKEAEATLLACKAGVTSAESSVQAGKANLEYNQLNLDWTQVKSPINGRVDRNLLTVGNLVTADVTTLTNIVNADDVYAYFDVDELCCLEIQRAIREGAYDEPRDVPIAVALQDEQNFPHKGQLNLVANKLNESTGTLKVRGLLKNPTKMLTAGNFVRVRLALDRPHNRLLVPDRAVVYDQGDTFLLIVKADDTVEKRKVAIGPLDPDDKTLRVIETGLKPGEWVVIEGRQHVRPGVPVKAERIGPPEKAAASPKKPPEKKEAAAKK
jgi:membrane fusion protein, multidrug efflux system